MTRLPVIQDQTILDRVRWLVANRADQNAVTLISSEGEQVVTHREFWSRAAQYAHALEAAGVQPGDLVVLVLQHGADVLYSFWGAMLLGAVPSIFPFLTEKLDPDRYFDSVQRLVALSEVRVVITYGELELRLKEALTGIESLAGILQVEDLQPGGDVADYLNRSVVKAGDTAFLQHSSGSTGLQKGVMLSHRAVLNQINAYGQAIQLADSDVIASWLPLYHDMGLIAGFIMPLLAGVPLVLMSPFYWVRDPAALLRAIHMHRATLCWLPNFAYNFMAMRIREEQADGLDLSSIRALINCSEPVYADSHRVFAARYAGHGIAPAALQTCYAMAENTFAVTQSVIGQAVRVDEVDRAVLLEQRRALPAQNGAASMTLVSCGQPVPGCEIRVVDEQRQSLPERAVGEVALRSNSMLSGYYHRPEASAEVMADGWFLTGDMGYLADGELYITGRKKDLVIIAGKNIYPQDVENLLNDVTGLHPGRAVAFGVPNTQLGTEDLGIVAEADSDDRQARAAIMREVRGRVVRNLDVVARYVHLVERGWLLKTSSGKVARRANRQKFIEQVIEKR